MAHIAVGSEAGRLPHLARRPPGLGLGHPQEGGHAPVPLEGEGAPRTWRALLRHLLQLPVVADEAGDEDGDDGEE